MAFGDAIGSDPGVVLPKVDGLDGDSLSLKSAMR